MQVWLATFCGILIAVGNAFGADVSQRLAEAHSAEFVVLKDGTRTTFTINDRDELRELASLLKTDGKVAKAPQGAPDLDDVIGVIVRMSDGSKTEFAVLEGKTLHYTSARGEKVYEGLLRTEFAISVKSRLPVDTPTPEERTAGRASMLVLEHLEHYQGDASKVGETFSVACTPNSRQLFVLTKSAISGFQCLPGTGGVRFVAATELGEDVSPVGMVMSPDGNHLYLLDVVRSVITAWRRESDGRLKPVETLKAPVRDARRLVFSPDGLHLYAAKGGSPDGAAVLQFGRDAKSGMLIVLDECRVKDCSAIWDLVVTDVAAFAVSFKDKALVSFRRDPQTGKLQLSDLRKANIVAGFVNPDEGLQDAKRVATSGTDIFVAGDRHLALFQWDGEKLQFRTLLRDENRTRTAGIHGLVVDENGPIYLATQNEVRRYRYDREQNKLALQASVAADSLGDQLVLAPDKKRLFTPSARGIVHVFGLTRFPGRK